MQHSRKYVCVWPRDFVIDPASVGTSTTTVGGELVAAEAPRNHHPVEYSMHKRRWVPCDLKPALQRRVLAVVQACDGFGIAGVKE